MQEVWKDVSGWEGKYRVSNLGRVMALNYRQVKGRTEIMSYSVNGHGYLSVIFTKNGAHKMYRVNRLVAEAFVPNPNNFPEVNHIDGDKKNNRADNLEWTDRKGNAKHASENGLYNSQVPKTGPTACVPVLATEIKTGNEMRFASITEASKTLGVNYSSISKCIKGERKKTNEYYFRMDGDKK